jgi:hypothetical protein
MTEYVRPPQNKPVLVPDPDARRDVPEEEEALDDEAEPGKGENAAGFVKPARDDAKQADEGSPLGSGSGRGS